MRKLSTSTVGVATSGSSSSSSSRRLMVSTTFGMSSLLSGCFASHDSNSTASQVAEVPAVVLAEPSAPVLVDNPEDPMDETTPIANLPDDLLRECLARIPRKAIGPALGVCRKWREIMQSSEYREVRVSLRRSEHRLVVLSANGKADSDSHPVRVQMFRPRANNSTYCVLKDRGIVIDDFSCCRSAEQKVFFLAGVVGNSRSHPPVIYDLWTNEVKPMQPLGCPRTRFVSGVIDGRLYVAGGLRSEGSGSSAASTVGPASELAGSLASIPTAVIPGESLQDVGTPHETAGGSFGTLAGARARLASVRISRKKAQQPQRTEPRELKSAEMYDPESDTWQFLPDMTHARVGGVGGAVGGRLFVLGETTKLNVARLQQVSQERPTHSLEIYDPVSNSWTLKDPIPRTGYILGSVVLGRSIFLMHSDNNKISWLKYDTDADTWHPLHDVPIPPDHRLTHLVKFDCTAVGNKIYVVQVWGGQDDLGHRPRGRSASGALVLKYDPTREGPEAWIRVADMPVVARGAVCTGAVC